MKESAKYYFYLVSRIFVLYEFILIQPSFFANGIKRIDEIIEFSCILRMFYSISEAISWSAGLSNIELVNQ